MHFGLKNKSKVWPGSSLDDTEFTAAPRLRYDGWAFGDGDEPWRYGSADRVSHLSFLLYLSSHPAGAGGETVLYLDRADGANGGANGSGGGGAVRVQPEAGDALVFGQSFRLGRRAIAESEGALVHEGAPLMASGRDDDSCKYVLRSDVLYRLPALDSSDKSSAAP